MNNNLYHIALILDGNKRWAKKNNLSNINGYLKGFENISNLVKCALSLNLPYLTIGFKEARYCNKNLQS